MAYVDHSGELKPTKDLDSEVWGKPTILGELKLDYIQQTLNCKFDRVEDLHQAYLAGANPRMGIELFRQVKVLLLPASTYTRTCRLGLIMSAKLTRTNVRAPSAQSGLLIASA